jgi:hypothetical protein
MLDNTHHILVTNCQSLATLAVALNVAYFTFRSANQPTFNKLVVAFTKAATLRANRHLNDNADIHSRFADLQSSHNHFLIVSADFYAIMDNIMVYVGYSISVLAIILLVLATFHDKQYIGDLNAFIILLILYLPVSLCIFAEFAISFFYAIYQRKINRFYDDCQRAIRASLMPKGGQVVHSTS